MTNCTQFAVVSRYVSFLGATQERTTRITFLYCHQQHKILLKNQNMVQNALRRITIELVITCHLGLQAKISKYNICFCFVNTRRLYLDLCQVVGLLNGISAYFLNLTKGLEQWIFTVKGDTMELECTTSAGSFTITWGLNRIVLKYFEQRRAIGS